MNTKITILAAGHGTRMNQEIPKPLTPVDGKPILQYLMESIDASGVDDDPVVVIGGEDERLCDAFDRDCTYAVQEEQLGTAHAVASAREQLEGADAVVVLYGDHPFIKPESLQALHEKHKESQATITMMTAEVPNFDGWHCAFTSWGRILRDEDGSIIGIREYEDASEEERVIKEVNPSLFCFDCDWLWENIDKIGNENAQGEYYLTDLIALAFEQGEDIASLKINPEEAIGINTQEDKKRAEKLYC
jgi:bifunctional UDP-N-acetylglucosamine pyrophosphorylase/glucosamine-1-phosphate N-acetyltransferase